MPDEPKVTRTPDSARDAKRDFRVGCTFLILMVLLLWGAIWLFWVFWPR